MIATSPPYVPGDLERFVELLWRPGDVREVRIPTPGRTDSGYFDSPQALVAAVGPLDGRENAYVTVNPVEPALLARAANRIKQRSKSTTGDTQVVERRWLPIDIDPLRPTGISASEVEREAALGVTRQVWGYLNELGWPEPVVAMSGNGYWMFYPIDLPNDATAKALVDGVLAHLAGRFNTAAVSIDTTVSNASRIVALIGMLKVKGDATADRPHRRSGLLRMPKELVAVTAEQLATLAPAKPADVLRGPVPVITVGGDRMPEGWVGKALDAAGVGYRKSERKGTTWYRLDRCPFHPDDDQGGDCGVGEDADGKALGHCFHNRGAGRTWQDFKAELGIETAARADWNPAPVAKPALRVASQGIDAADLLAMELPPIRWIVPDLIPEGTTIIAAPPKVGKSCLVYEIVVEASLGGDLLGRKVERGSALYLALEDGKRRGQARLRAALAGREMPRGFLEVRWDAPLIGQGLEEDVAAWLDVHPDAVLVAIDTLQKVRPNTSGKRGAYEVDVDDLGRLQTLFRDRRVALLIVHHARKDASDDFLASVSGTYGITGSADTIIVIKRKRNEAFGQIYVTGRDVADAELSVRFDGLLWSSAPASLAESSFERREILAVIETQGPIFPAAIAERVGLVRQSVQNMCTAMVDQGLIARTAGGYIVADIGATVTDRLDVSDVSFSGAYAPARDTHIPGVSDVSDTTDTGDTRARARETSANVSCRDYIAHQLQHRRGPNGYFCPRVIPRRTHDHRHRRAPCSCDAEQHRRRPNPAPPLLLQRRRPLAGRDDHHRRPGQAGPDQVAQGAGRPGGRLPRRAAGRRPGRRQRRGRGGVPAGDPQRGHQRPRAWFPDPCLARGGPAPNRRAGRRPRRSGDRGRADLAQRAEGPPDRGRGVPDPRDARLRRDLRPDRRDRRRGLAAGLEVVEVGCLAGWPGVRRDAVAARRLCPRGVHRPTRRPRALPGPADHPLRHRPCHRRRDAALSRRRQRRRLDGVPGLPVAVLLAKRPEGVTAVLAIDPGPVRSAWLLLTDGQTRPGNFGIESNEYVLALIKSDFPPADTLVIEQIRSYGMSVGAEVFDTVHWSGRFHQASKAPVILLPRLKVKQHLCHDSKAKDGNIRQALIDRFGGEAAIGRKATPGPLYGISADVWQALALALTFAEGGAA